MTFSVHWAIVTDSIEMYQHVMTSTSLSSQNPSIILNRFLVKWMECLLLWENKSKALNSINQIKITWKFRLSKKKTVNHLWTWHCIKHTLFIFTLKALHDLSTLYLSFFLCYQCVSSLHGSASDACHHHPFVMFTNEHLCPFSHASLHAWKKIP